MPKLNNIEFFNRFCLTLFDELYSKFPAKVSVNVSEIANKAIPEGADFDDAFDSYATAREVITFLQEEGFITYYQFPLKGEVFHQVRLTMKSLAILGCPSSLLEKEASIIDSVKVAVSDGGKDATSKLVSSLITDIFGMASGVPPIRTILATIQAATGGSQEG